ncbi:hypothetical protein [Sphingobium yanoikuyae]|uniref:hypothetical protein n=1 Tax=Sphingobium yanoikuyae TaxID=13690 RepID=UPI0035C78F05
MSVELVPSLPSHIGRLARDMRDIDRIECLAMGHEPKAALRSARRRSLWSLTVLADGAPIAMLGLVAMNLVEGVGLPWFLATDAAYKQGRSFLVEGSAVIALMRQSTPTLINLVSADNSRAIRTLKRWGFSIGDVREVHGGVPFLPFRMSDHV